MKHWVKSLLFFCLYYSGMEWLLSQLITPPAVAVLMYHGVCDDALIPRSINFHVDRLTFQRQMLALSRRYSVLRLSAVVSMLSEGRPLKHSVVVTFDDGYRNNATHADPVLQKLRLPYSIFIATSFIGSEQWIPLNRLYYAWSDGRLTLDEMNSVRAKLRSEPALEAESILRSSHIGQYPISVSKSAEESFAMLDWEQVRILARSGVEFGSHTHSHANLAVETPDRICDELRTSRQLMERELGSPVKMFAYPYGAVSSLALEAVMQARYECGVSTEYGLVSDRSDIYRLPRIGHHPRIWMFTGEILFQFIKFWWVRRFHSSDAGEVHVS